MSKLAIINHIKKCYQLWTSSTEGVANNGLGKWLISCIIWDNRIGTSYLRNPKDSFSDAFFPKKRKSKYKITTPTKMAIMIYFKLL